MATVTGLTAERMLEIEAESIVDAHLAGYNLILTRHDGTPIDVGDIRGPVGPVGPPDVNSVKVTTDQNIDGLKTFQKKVSIELAAPGTAVRIGQGAAPDALNITPYGAAAVVFASGAERDGAGNSYARGASATQLEQLNDSVNIYADVALTPGVAYGRTKVLGIDSSGMLQITRPAAGQSLWIKKEAASMSGASMSIGRTTPATQPQSIIFSGGVAVNLIVGRSAGVDHLEFGYDGGAGFVKTGHYETGGGWRAAGSVHYFGGGALGADMSALVIGQYDADYAQVTAYNAIRANTGLLITSKGLGVIILRNGTNPANSLTLDSGGKVTVSAGNGAGVPSDGLEIYCSPNAVGNFVGLRIHSNWGAGGGGHPLHIQNAVGTVFDMDPNGVFEWGPGANIAGMFTSSANAGGGQAVPATVVGFMLININGTPRKIPYFAN